MESHLSSILLLQIGLIILNAIFACAEIAIITINDNKLDKLAKEGNKNAMRLKKLTSQPAKFLATIQVAITLAGFLGSAFAADNFSEPIVQYFISKGSTIPYATLDMIAVIFITLVLSFFTLVFGELVPKRIAMKKAESIALLLSSFIMVVSKAFSPIVWVLTISTDFVLLCFGIDPNVDEEEVSEEEILMMVDIGIEKGVIDQEECQFIQNIFKFDDTSAKDIVTHRTKVCVLYLEDAQEEWDQVIMNNEFTFFPVCDDNKDRVIGVLNAKEYFRLEDKSRKSVLDSVVLKPYYIHEDNKADMILKNMKKTRNHFGVVVDEYGGMTGVITINDLIEELIGEFA